MYSTRPCQIPRRYRCVYIGIALNGPRCLIESLIRAESAKHTCVRPLTTAIRMCPGQKLAMARRVDDLDNLNSVLAGCCGKCSRNPIPLPHILYKPLISAGVLLAHTSRALNKTKRHNWLAFQAVLGISLLRSDPKLHSIDLNDESMTSLTDICLPVSQGFTQALRLSWLTQSNDRKSGSC